MPEKEKEDRAAEERREGRRESELVRQIRSRTDLANPKTALTLYNKLIGENLFHTLVGEVFLEELRDIVLEGGVATAEELPDLPKRDAEEEKKKKEPTSMPVRRDRYKKMYEGQQLLNKKLKVTVAALVAILVGFVIINFRFEYSIFTYFTNYKANMEEELINKYRSWETRLQEQQNQLEQRGAEQNG